MSGRIPSVVANAIDQTLRAGPRDRQGRAERRGQLRESDPRAPGVYSPVMGNLKDRYCIVGVGETEYSHNSGRTTRAMAVEAIKKAMDDTRASQG